MLSIFHIFISKIFMIIFHFFQVENADSNLPNTETDGQSSDESTLSLNGASGLSDEDSESSNIPNVVRFQNAPRTFNNHPSNFMF